jgi:hypothetical protein
MSVKSSSLTGVPVSAFNNKMIPGLKPPIATNFSSGEIAAELIKKS